MNRGSQDCSISQHLYVGSACLLDLLGTTAVDERHFNTRTHIWRASFQHVNAGSARLLDLLGTTAERHFNRTHIWRASLYAGLVLRAVKLCSLAYTPWWGCVLHMGSTV